MNQCENEVEQLSSELAKSYNRISELERILNAATGLNEIVEGVKSQRWSVGGLRLKDTAEWVELYCAIKEHGRKGGK